MLSGVSSEEASADAARALLELPSYDLQSEVEECLPLGRLHVRGAPSAPFQSEESSKKLLRWIGLKKTRKFYKPQCNYLLPESEVFCGYRHNSQITRHLGVR